jgi:hypothetical protein
MKTRIDVEKFTNLEIPESCYILGFLWGDGYFYKNSVQLEILTKDFLSIKDLLWSIGPWTLTHRKRDGRKPQTRAQFSSKDIFNFLSDYNFLKHSTKSPIILNDIPEKTRHYFLRGLIDADGSFYCDPKLKTYQFNLAGSFNQEWSNITHIFDKLNIIYKVLNRKHSVKPHKNSIVRITGIKNINILGEYIYNDKVFGLERKKDKYIDILKNSIRIPVNTKFNLY